MPTSFSFPEERYILTGKVTKAHGLRGDLKCVPLSDLFFTTLNEVRFALIADDGRMTKPLRSEKVRIQGRMFILKLESIDTRNEAERTVGMGVLLLKEDLPEAHADMVYPRQLEGLKVKDATSGEFIGVVKTTFNNGAQDILVVGGKENEFLIPFVDAIVTSYDETEILIDPPPGLLEINDPKRG